MSPNKHPIFHPIICYLIVYVELCYQRASLDVHIKHHMSQGCRDQLYVLPNRYHHQLVYPFHMKHRNKKKLLILLMIVFHMLLKNFQSVELNADATFDV